MYPHHLIQVRARKLYTNKNLSYAKNLWKKEFVHMVIDASSLMALMSSGKTTAKTANTRQNNAWFFSIPATASMAKDATLSMNPLPRSLSTRC